MKFHLLNGYTLGLLFVQRSRKKKREILTFAQK